MRASVNASTLWFLPRQHNLWDHDVRARITIYTYTPVDNKVFIQVVHLVSPLARLPSSREEKWPIWHLHTYLKSCASNQRSKSLQNIPADALER